MVCRDALLVLLSLLESLLPAASRSDCRHALVDTETMREVMSGIAGYDTAAATNQSRFVADFLFGLARRPEIAGRAGTFQVQPERFFEGLARCHGPPHRRGADQHAQGARTRSAVRRRYANPVDITPASVEAQQVLGVRASWPDTPGAADHYSYHDTMAEPSIRLHHERVITYLLIDFGDFVAYENMRGIHGRPTSGALGALFGLLGMAEIHQSRFAVAEDQTQVNWSRGAKLFSFTALTTITPEGVAERGIPDHREDLQELAEKLEIDIEVEARDVPPRACDVED